ncbi:MAG TPA: hypothetical protein VJK03_04770 [Candidatus Nanoarchaeia archaeon]|nr:hypothetical protein [Candidatus Nanoarchaeia archaeon]
MAKKSLKKAGGAIAGIFGMIAVSPLLLHGITELEHELSPTAKTREGACIMLQEEKEKLGIDAPIELRIFEDDSLKEKGVLAYTGRHPKEGYTIGASKSSLNRIIFRHELYHVKRDCLATVSETKEGDLPLLQRRYFFNGRNYFIEEPRANLYALFGIRL